MADSSVTSPSHGYFPGDGPQRAPPHKFHPDSYGGYVPPARSMTIESTSQSSVTMSHRTRALSFGDDADFNHNLGLAVFSALCCCWPIGILAVMNAVEAKKQYRYDDMGRAYESAYQARKYTKWSIGIGLTLLIVVGIASIIILSYRV